MSRWNHPLWELAKYPIGLVLLLIGTPALLIAMLYYRIRYGKTNWEDEFEARFYSDTQ